MEDKFQKKYRTTSFRKPNWDYGSHGLYFVTICTKDRVNYFGEIGLDKETQSIVSLQETTIAKVAFDNWHTIPEFHPFVELDEFILMPNHLHGILFINKPNKTDWDFSKFGVQSQNLGSVIRGYKASVKKFATINDIEFFWQAKYHDKVIRDDREYWAIKNYIHTNQENWLNDPENIFSIK